MGPLPCIALPGFQRQASCHHATGDPLYLSPPGKVQCNADAWTVLNGLSPWGTEPPFSVLDGMERGACCHCCFAGAIVLP
jgi:hypothetical protein